VDATGENKITEGAKWMLDALITLPLIDLKLNVGKNANISTYLTIFYKHFQGWSGVEPNLPVAGVVNSRGDAVGVVSGEAEAVVLLEVLIGSHTERGKRWCHMTNQR